MSIAITIIVGGACILLAVLGAWRGMQRGALALSATLLGIVLADLWGATLGEWLVTQFEAQSAGATSMMSALLLLLTALLGGYGGGLLLTRPPKIVHWSKRVSGAILGLLNAIALVGFLLKYAAQSNPDTADLITSSPAAHVVHENLANFFLAATSIAICFLGGTHILRMIRARQATPAFPPPMSRPPIPGSSMGGMGVGGIPSTARPPVTPTAPPPVDKQVLDKLNEKMKELDRR